MSLNVTDLTRIAKETGVPDHLIEGLIAYAVDRRPTGDFLKSVLSNDLFGALQRADSRSLNGLLRIAAFVQYHLPYDSFGSEEIVSRWLSRTNSVT